MAVGVGEGDGGLGVWVRGLRVWGEQVRSVKERCLHFALLPKGFFPQSPFILSKIKEVFVWFF